MLRVLKLTIPIVAFIGALTWYVFNEDAETVGSGGSATVAADTGGKQAGGTAYEVDQSGQPRQLGGGAADGDEGPHYPADSEQHYEAPSDSAPPEPPSGDS